MKVSQKKKSCFSEESVRVSATPKLSEFLRQNPRIPKKISKTNKLKCVNPTVRTVGQLSCGGNGFPTTVFGFQVEPGREPVRQDFEPMTNVDDVTCPNMNRTFFTTLTPRPHLDSGDHQFDENWLMSCGNRMAFQQILPESEPQIRLLPESEFQNKFTPALDINLNSKPATLNRKTSENGVQVNMFHCKDCRRHIKYGKNFNYEYSCTESDSETNLFDSTCITCESTNWKENVTNVGGEEEDAEEKSDQDQVHNSSDHESPLDHNSPTLRSELLSKYGWKKMLLSDIRFVTAVILTISVILYLTQMQIFGVISKITFYIRKTIVQEEIEEKFSFFNWISNVLINTQDTYKPRPLFINLF